MAAAAAFEGLWIPLITPFRDGQVDHAAAKRLVGHLLDGGVDGFVVCGTTGEPATMSEDEQAALLATVLKAAGRVPVVMGVSGNDTAATAALAKRWSAQPIAGLLVPAPYYTRPSQEGIQRHFEAIAAASGKPIVIYNIPYRSGVTMELPLIQALAANPQFVAIKESGSGNMNALMDLCRDTTLKVLSGEDHLIFVTCCLGGHGAIAAAAHLHPELYKQMIVLARGGEVEKARAIHERLLPLVRALFAEPNPGPIKAALAAQGLIADELRLPMTPASAACREAIQELLATF